MAPAMVLRFARPLVVLLGLSGASAPLPQLAATRVLSAAADDGTSSSDRASRHPPRSEHLAEVAEEVHERRPLPADRQVSASESYKDAEYEFRDDFWVGVLLECFGQLINVSGKHCVGYGRRMDNKLPWNTWDFWKGAGLWYTLGTVAVCIYILMDLVALGYADQTIITACSGSSVVWNSLLAPVTLGEAVTFSRFTGACIIVGGTAGVAIFGNHYTVAFTSEQYLELMGEPQAIAFYIVWSIAFALIALLVWDTDPAEDDATGPGTDAEADTDAGSSEQSGKEKSTTSMSSSTCKSLRSCKQRFLTLPSDPNVRGFMWGVLSGLVAGNAWATKIFSELFFSGEWDNYLTWLFGLLTLAIHGFALGVVFWAIKYYDALVVVTASDSFNVVVGTCSGLLVLQEAQIPPLSTLDLTFYLISVFVIVGGLLWILAKPKWCCKTDDPVPCCVRFYHCLGLNPGTSTTLERQKSSSAKTDGLDSSLLKDS